MTVRYAEEEEARWLDRWAETHQPLGSSGGRFTVKRATEEESAWLDRLSGAAKGAREDRDGKDGGDRQSVEFDHDDPYVVSPILTRIHRIWLANLFLLRCVSFIPIVYSPRCDLRILTSNVMMIISCLWFLQPWPRGSGLPRPLGQAARGSGELQS
jgi:hypothetical protein